MSTSRQEFERRFDEVLARATSYTSEQIGHPVELPTRFVLDMSDVSGEELSRAEAVDRLYLGPNLSYVFIDVGVHLGREHSGAAWVRPSAHHPRHPDEVWDASGIGPFKNLGGFATVAEWEAAKVHGIRSSSSRVTLPNAE
ncbi:MAG: hypothetical protein ABIZ52_08330 [Candidatus Limnocylindrales bacterium]